MKTMLGKIVFGILIILIFHVLYKNFDWKNSTKRYAVGFVNKKTSQGTAGVFGEYSFLIKETKYFGEVGNENINFNKFFIVEFIDENPKRNRISIHHTIDPEKLVPQPPGGWTECPINEDGSIKEKYKRHKTKEQTEENQITGVEFSAQDSAQVTKSSVDFLKQHKNP